MFDGLHACTHRGVRTFIAMGVCHHRHTTFRGFVDDPRELLLSEGLLAWISVRESGALGSTRLDDVDLVIEVDAHDRP